MNFDFDIKKKNVRIMLVALVGLICYAFLPYITVKVSFMNQSQSESRNLLSGDLFFAEGFGFVSFVGLVCLIAFVGIIATAFLKKANENLLCCFAGGIAGIVSLIATLVKCGSLEKETMGMGTVSGGIGLWLGVIALIACAAMAFLLPNDAE